MTARGGLRLTLAETGQRARLIDRFYRSLPNTAAVHDGWRRLIVAHSVAGVQAHEAPLVAPMNVHGVSHLLTLNVSDFAHYPGVTANHP